MRTGLLTIFLTLLSISFSFAQVELEGNDSPSFKDRLYFGGGGNLQFTQDVFLIGVSPLAGYMITDRWSSGLGLTYQYMHIRLINNNVSVHTYGPRFFSRYNVFRSAYVMGEYELLNTELARLGDEQPRLWVDRLLLGGGYFQRMGRRGGVNLGIFYDFLYRAADPNSPYNSPWVYRFGLTF